MADRTIEILAKLTDRISRPLGNIRDRFGRFRGSVTNLRKAFGPLTGAATGFIAAFAGIAGIRKSLDLAEQQVQAERALLTAVGENVQQFEKLRTLASEIQRRTTFGDEKIIKTLALLKESGVEFEQLPRAIEAIVQTAAVSGDSLEAIARQLVATVGGETRAITTLARRFPALAKELEALSEDQLRAGEQFDVFAESFAGRAEALASTTFGKVEQASNRIGDSFERLGKIVVEFQADILTTLVTTFEGVIEVFERPFAQGFLKILRTILAFFVQFAPQAVAVVGAIVGITVAVKLTTLAWAAFQVVLAAVGVFLSPGGLLIAGILALTALLLKSTGAIDALVAGFSGIGADIGKLVTGIGKGTASVDDLVTFIGNKFKLAALLIDQNFITPVTSFFSFLVAFGTGTFNVFVAFAKNIFLSLASAIEGAFLGAVRGIALAFDTLTGLLGDAVNASLFLAAEVTDIFDEELANKIRGVGESFKTDLAGQVGEGSASLKASLESSKRDINALGDALTGLPKKFAGDLAIEAQKLQGEINALEEQNRRILRSAVVGREEFAAEEAEARLRAQATAAVEAIDQETVVAKQASDERLQAELLAEKQRNAAVIANLNREADARLKLREADIASAIRAVREREAAVEFPDQQVIDRLRQQGETIAGVVTDLERRIEAANQRGENTRALFQSLIRFGEDETRIATELAALEVERNTALEQQSNLRREAQVLERFLQDLREEGNALRLVEEKRITDEITTRRRTALEEAAANENAIREAALARNVELETAAIEQRRALEEKLLADVEELRAPVEEERQNAADALGETESATTDTLREQTSATDATNNLKGLSIDLAEEQLAVEREINRVLEERRTAAPGELGGAPGALGAAGTAGAFGPDDRAEFESDLDGIADSFDEIGVAAEKAGILTGETLAKSGLAAQEAAAQAGGAADEITDRFAGVRSALTAPFQEFFSTLISGSATAKQAFKGLVDSLLQQVTQFLAQQATQAFLGALFGAPTGGGGGSGILGAIFGFAEGGGVPGDGPAVDSVPAMLTPGEFVVRRQAVAHYGPAALEAINRMIAPRDLMPRVGHGAFTLRSGGFQDGGRVSPGGGGGGGTDVLPVLVAEPDEVERFLRGGAAGLMRVLRENSDELSGITQSSRGAV